jgi:DNA-binding CsgD family transcriptional regulator
MYANGKNEHYIEIINGFSNLTAREIEVAELMVEKLAWKEIAEKLHISSKTATKHGSNIYSKFGVKTREEFIEHIKLLKER